MRKLLILGIAAIVSFGILIGCGGSFRSSELQRPVLEETEQIIYKNLTLKASVAVVKHELITEGNIKKVRAQFKNMVSYTINAEIRVKWLDASGFELSDTQGWFPLTMMKGDMVPFERFAPSPNATDYRIIIQLAGTN